MNRGENMNTGTQRTRIVVAGLLSCALVMTSGSTALANPSMKAIDEAEVQAIERAITESLPDGALANGEPRTKGTFSKEDPSKLNLDGVSLSISLEGKYRSGITTGESLVIEDGNTEYLVQETGEGAQVLFNIGSPSSDHSKTFTISGNKKLVPSQEYGIDTGEVFVVNDDGSIHSSFDTPWAYDAEGNSVPTRFEISGNTITQVVEPKSDSIYPIVADPDWGKIAMCAGTIIGNAALYIVPGGIVARLLAKGNSVRKAAEILVRTLNAKSYNDKLKALRNLALNLGADVTGIGAIAKACG